jgi:hypothetical protein
MNPFVLNTILADSWFAAGLGYNHTIKPSRVSPPGGFKGTARVAGRYYEPPATNVRNASFHYYHIGQMPTHFLGMFNVIPGKWYSVEDLINKDNHLIDAVLTNGVTLSPRHVFIMKSPIDCNLIVATLVVPGFDYGETVIALAQEEFPVFLVTSEDGGSIPLDGGKRVTASINIVELVLHFSFNHRANAADIRHPAQWDFLSHSKIVQYDCAMLATTSEVTSFLDKYTDQLFAAWVIANGKIMTVASALAAASTLVGKELCVHYDRTIKVKQFHNFGSSATMTSNENGVRKHIINIGAALESPHDVSLFLGIGNDTTFKGLSLDNRHIELVQQVTNHHLAINDVQLNELRLKHGFLNTGEDLVIYAVIRKSTLSRMGGSQYARLDVLTGLGTTLKNNFLSDAGLIPEWQGISLELNEYNVLRNSPVRLFNENRIVDGYGYVGLSRLFTPALIKGTTFTRHGNTYSKFKTSILSRERTKKLPTRSEVEVIAYGLDNKLETSKYLTQNIAGMVTFKNKDLKYIESNLVRQLFGTLKGNHKLYGNQVLNADALFYGWQCYVCEKENGVANQEWFRAVKDLHYTIATIGVNKTIVWNTSVLNLNNLVGCFTIGGDVSHVVTYVRYINLRRGYMSVNFVTDVDGLMPLPSERVDVWLAGGLLIEGIDYLVGRDQIIIFKKFTSINDEVRIRLSGLPLDGSHSQPLETGYVDRGKISFDHKSRIFRGKEVQINIGGEIQHASTICYGHETENALTGYNGKPYQIKEHIQPLEGYTDANTFDEVDRMHVMENVIVDTLNTLAPINYVRETTTLALGLHHQVVSVFLNEIIYQILNEGLIATQISGTYTKAMTDGWFAPLLYLLEYDVSLNPILNINFITVNPHEKTTINVNTHQLRLFNFVNQNYLNSKVTMTGRFTVV